MTNQTTDEGENKVRHDCKNRNSELNALFGYGIQIMGAVWSAGYGCTGNACPHKKIRGKQ